MISIYQAAVPPALRTLRNLGAVLAKGEAHCLARSIEPGIMLQSRLYPDMFPLERQVQIVSDTGRRLGARLASLVPPSIPDTETSFAELLARLTASATFLESLVADQFEDAETREIVLPGRNSETRLSGLAYLQAFAIPTLYFHATTAFAILRHNGVEIGKLDYLGTVTD